MSHHSDEFDPEFEARMRQRGVSGILGLTGQFPDGKLSERDYGEIAFTVAVYDGRVVIDFGDPVTWLGMTSDEARDLGNLLLEYAMHAEEHG